MLIAGGARRALFLNLGHSHPARRQASPRQAGTPGSFTSLAYQGRQPESSKQRDTCRRTGKLDSKLQKEQCVQPVATVAELDKALLLIEEQVDPGARPAWRINFRNLIACPGDDRREGSIVMDAAFNHRTAIVEMVGKFHPEGGDRRVGHHPSLVKNLDHRSILSPNQGGDDEHGVPSGAAGLGALGTYCARVEAIGPRLTEGAQTSTWPKPDGSETRSSGCHSGLHARRQGCGCRFSEIAVFSSIFTKLPYRCGHDPPPLSGAEGTSRRPRGCCEPPPAQVAKRGISDPLGVRDVSILRATAAPIAEPGPKSHARLGARLPVGRVGLEPTTHGLKVHCSTN